MIVLRILLVLIALACSSAGCVAWGSSVTLASWWFSPKCLGWTRGRGKAAIGSAVLLGCLHKWIGIWIRLGDEILRFSFELDWTSKLGLHQSPNVTEILECLLFSTVTSSQPCIAWCFALPAWHGKLVCPGALGALGEPGSVWAKFTPPDSRHPL